MKPDPKALLFAIFLGAASALAVVTSIVSLEACKPGWNDPHPVVAEPNNPCGVFWYSCGVAHDGKHRCCYYTDDCRPGGGCAFGGGPGPTWGSRAPDAGRRETPQMTPEEIRRRRGY